MAFPSGWIRRCSLTISHTNVDADLTAFTVILTKDSLPSEMFDADGSYPALNGGGDIRFSADEAGTTQLPCDIRTFTTDNDPANGVADIAVKCNVSGTSDTVIYVWYNKSGETQPAANDTYGQYNAYDANMTVWDGRSLDSRTTTVRTLTAVGNASYNNLDSGHRYFNFDGVDDGMYVAAWRTAAPLVIHGLMYVDPASGPVLIWNGDSNLGGWSAFYCSAVVGTGNFSAGIAQPTNDFGNGTILAAFSTNTWTYYAARYTSSSSRRAYINASSGNETTSTKTPTNIDLFHLGGDRTYSDGTINNDFKGRLSETRVSSADRSAAWLKAEYYNLLDNANFITEGTPETPGGSSITLDAIINLCYKLFLNNDKVLGYGSKLQRSNDKVVNFSYVSTLSNDTINTFETLNNPLYTKILNTAYNLNLFKTTTFNDSHLLDLAWLNIINLEDLLNLSKEREIDYTHLQSVNTLGLLNLEFGGTNLFNSSIILNFEHLANLFQDSQINLDNTFGILRTNILNYANLASIRNNYLLDLEFGGENRLDFDGLFNIEHILNLSRDSLHNYDFNSSLFTYRSVPLEILGSIGLLSPFSSEWFSPISSNRILNSEFLLNLGDTKSFNITNTRGLNLDRTIPSTYLSSILSGKIIPIDYSGDTSILLNSVLNFEFLSPLDVSRSFLYTFSLGLILDSEVPTEVLEGFTASRILSLFWNGSSVTPTEIWVVDSRNRIWQLSVRSKIWTLLSR